MANKVACQALILVALIGSASLVQAASYLDDMATIEAQIALANKRAELQSVLRNGKSAVVLPTVMSIIVDGKGATAQIAYASGLRRWVSRGDSVADGLSIGKITTGEVEVVGKGVKQSLAFFSDEPSGTAPESGLNIAPPSINIPPLPRFNGAQEVPVARTPGA